MKEKRWALIMLNRTALTVFLYASFLYFLKRIVFVKRHVWFFRIYQEESILYLHINNICKIILCIVLRVKIKQSPCSYRKNKGNCYSLILFSVLRSVTKIRIFFIHPYTFVMQNLWILCICTLICITLCFICSDSYVM